MSEASPTTPNPPPEEIELEQEQKEPEEQKDNDAHMADTEKREERNCYFR